MGRKDIHIDGEETQFEPGKSGNPQGSPKGVPNAATRYKRFLQLVQPGKNPVTGEQEEFTVAELMDLRQIKKALDGDLNAYKEILDRLEGKAKQQTEHTGPDGGPIQVAQEQTIIQVKFRKGDATPTESADHTTPKGRRKSG